MSFRNRFDDGTVMSGCSICGAAEPFPLRMRYCSDGLFRCWRHTETETPTDYARKTMANRQIRDEVAPSFPVGPKPGIYE